MATKIINPTIIEAAGNKPKQILEYIGRVNSGTKELSIAQMISPGGWEEPGQTPEFDEYTLVLKGILHVETKKESFKLLAGEAVILTKGEWVRYSTPDDDGAQYIAVCLPAFSPLLVHRDKV
jgi:quercetin dioxygenase-like cupin family protein